MSDTGAPPPNPAARRGAGRGVKIALAISLSLNLLIVGLVAGAILGADRRGGDASPGLREMGLGPFALALPREDRADLRARLDGADVRRERVAIGMSLRRLQAALRADPFDRAAAEAALSQSRRAAGALQARGHEALLDQLEAMGPAARTVLADRLDRALRRAVGRSGRPDR